MDHVESGRLDRDKHKIYYLRSKYNKFEYFEETNSVYEAIRREKQLKKWNRIWKLDLVNNHNPASEDLWYKLMDLPIKLEDDE